MVASLRAVFACLQVSVMMASATEQDVLHSNSLLQSKARGSRAASAGTSDAVQKYVSFVQDLATKVAIHNTPLTDAETAALKTIRTFMTKIIDDARASLAADQKVVDAVRDSFVACGQTCLLHQKQHTGTSGDLNIDFVTKGNQHQSCRLDTEEPAYNEWKLHCTQYDTSRKNVPPPSCMKDDLDAADVKTDDKDTLLAMETCLTLTEKWLTPLYALYEKCKTERQEHAAAISSCNVQQGWFETSFCTYVAKQDDICDAQDDCRVNSEKSRSVDYDAVRVSEVARTADMESATLIECYFKVFEAANAEKPDKLSDCQNMDVTDNIASSYSITYHPVPAAATCVKVESYPCVANWIAQWYGNLPTNAPATTCRACN